jgi:formiminoglutamase
VRAIDLAEFDPSLDVSDIGALTAGRWFAEVLAGHETRRRY